MRWLAEFPSTGALVAMYILVVLATTAAVIAGWKPPADWFLFVGGVGTLATTHFTAKRITQHKPPDPPSTG